MYSNWDFCMSIQKISNCYYCKRNNHCIDDDYKTSHIGKISGFLIGSAIGTKLVTSQMKALKTIDGKKNLLEKFYLDLNNSEDAPKRKIIRNADGKIIKPAGGINERSKIIVNSHRKYYTKWGAVITLLTTGLGILTDRSISAVNKKEHDLLNKQA